MESGGETQVRVMNGKTLETGKGLVGWRKTKRGKTLEGGLMRGM